MRMPWQRDRELDALERKAQFAFARVEEALANQTAMDLQDEDASWRKISNAANAEDLSDVDRAEACRKCLNVWMLDPGLARAAALLQSGTFGKGITTPRAADQRVQSVVDRFWGDDDNVLYLTGRDARVLTNLKLMIYGEQFFTVHVSAAGSEVKIGEVSASEITEVITHPDSKRRPILYQRKFRPDTFDFDRGGYVPGVEQRTWYYRDWRYLGEDLAAEDDVAAGVFGRSKDLQEFVYIYHLKTNTVGKRGVPEFYRAYDWAKAHHKSLSSLATWTQAAAMFAWRLKMKTKSQAAISNAAAAFREPAPGTAAVHVGNDGVDLSAVDQPSGAANMTGTVREMHIEAVRSFPFGAHYYGDNRDGTLATASSMELPAIWGIEDRQETFKELYLGLLGVAIERAIVLQDFPTRKLPASVDRYVDLDFPPAQPEQALQQAQAIAALAPFIDPQETAAHAYNALGSNDVDQLLERQFPQEDKLEGETADVDGDDAVDTAMLQAQAGGEVVPVAEAASDVMRPFPSGDPEPA
jgi:hypothetical protein